MLGNGQRSHLQATVVLHSGVADIFAACLWHPNHSDGGDFYQFVRYPPRSSLHLPPALDPVDGILCAVRPARPDGP